MNQTQDYNTVGALVRKLESDFTSEVTRKSKYVEESLYEDISRIEAYLSSKHISGDKDSMGRDKPFFNISLAARNIWFRATDLDRKNISIKDENALVALVAKIYVHEWMKRENFGQFLNNWGLVSAGYNEAVVKFVEKGGDLHAMVVPWSRLICDSVDFESNPKIEILELTPAQLRQNKSYDKEMVESLLNALQARETTGKYKKDNKSQYVKLYEIHGNLPLSYLTGKEEDEDEYTQQMHVISFVAGKEKGTWEDYSLYSGREAQDPYMLTALLPEVDGSIGLNGAIKNMFEAQWMQNHSTKAIKDHLDLANKLIFQTSDTTYKGQNALKAIETGDILLHSINQPLTQVPTNSHDISAFTNFQEQWKLLGNEVNGISEAMLGQNPPSGTAWRQTQAILNESHSLFDIMTENKGLYLEKMLRSFVLPYIRKKLNNTDKLVATLEANDIRKIDGIYVKNQAIKKTKEEIKKMLIEGQPVSPETQDQMIQANIQDLQSELKMAGNTRTFKPSEISTKTWRELFKDLEWDIEINITGEASNDNETLTTLTTILQIIGNNPESLKNPTFATLFNKAVSLTGAISPIEIEQTLQEGETLPPQQSGDVGAEALSINQQQNVGE